MGLYGSPLSRDQVKKVYEKIYDAGEPEDAWHRYSTSVIGDFIRRSVVPCFRGREVLVLNAGAGGEDYGLGVLRSINTDMIIRSVSRMERPLVSLLENIPIADSRLDVAVCVGSVLNYVDAGLVIAELSRCVKAGGIVVLEFERTETLEFVFTKTFRSQIASRVRYYRGERHQMYVYSESLIRKNLIANNLAVLGSLYFHMLSPLLLRLSRSLGMAASVTFLDRFLRKATPMNNLAGNALLLCLKAPDSNRCPG